eukprot:CAMPEP_0197679924 /NCGR_PEP_ID=MMETSP1338-20131121/92460_1 /TAXON_ID=43686 ORGANISM="Pelagodinium beii, Strain RCC1491" /NCGR_SAMPLE_ID=MMETSP1338 /ASSEMBLY_ACC=CAM_ASM_000754 /LENGTH=48 /DNA_ID= /DNA_START= /DNA_END= /DNA_ORIENTATION=
MSRDKTAALGTASTKMAQVRYTHLDVLQMPSSLVIASKSCSMPLDWQA